MTSFAPLVRTLFVLSLVGCAADPLAPPAPPIHASSPATPPVVASAPAERCSDTAAGFDTWLIAFRERAVARGVSRIVATGALGTVEYDPAVLELDRAQGHHKVTFEAFVASHVTAARVRRGRRLMAKHATLLANIEARFGVPPEIVVALWGLETDFGAYQGKTRSLDALATLAYDCRRAALFRDELTSALRILQRGDLSVDEMVGAWAGELGQTQFLPSSYERFGVDFDGDGRVNLIASVDDALASTAKYLAGNGWVAHEGYGPGSKNLTVMESWNASETYRRTVVVFASRLIGARE